MNMDTRPAPEPLTRLKVLPWQRPFPECLCGSSARRWRRTASCTPCARARLQAAFLPIDGRRVEVAVAGRRCWEGCQIARGGNARIGTGGGLFGLAQRGLLGGEFPRLLLQAIAVFGNPRGIGIDHRR